MAKTVVECATVLWRSAVIQSQENACVLLEDWGPTVNKVRIILTCPHIIFVYPT